MRRSMAVLLGIVLTCDFACADDWPQFQGIDRTGRSNETGLLTSWPDEGPPMVWNAQGVGSGFSSLAVVGNQIFTIGDLADGQYVFALSREDGGRQWKTKIGPVNRNSYRGSRSTPTVDNGKLYVLSSDSNLVCLESTGGTVLWQRHLRSDFGAHLMLAMGQYEWQFSESPLVDGDRVVVTPGYRDAAIVALNKQDGSTIWSSTLPDLGEKGADGAGYCSMVVAEIDGCRQYVQLLGRGVVGIDAASGKFLWGYNRIANDVANIPTPVVLGNHIFVSTGYQTGTALLEVKQRDGQWLAEEKYFLPPQTFQNHHGGFILHEGHIYAGHGHKMGLPVCLDFETGEIMWGPERNLGQGSASIAYADGHIYMRYEDGLMVLVAATPEGYQEKESFMIPDVRAKSWSRPVISGGKLYLKEQDTLYCYDVSR